VKPLFQKLYKFKHAVNVFINKIVFRFVNESGFSSKVSVTEEPELVINILYSTNSRVTVTLSITMLEGKISVHNNNTTENLKAKEKMRIREICA